MRFEDALKATAGEIEALLDRILPVEAAQARRLVEAMRYSALGQGKRLRPFFVAESARLCGARRAHALRTGAAIECVHCYSLVHDDLPAMDDDDLRRGRPTTHIAFDDATAILAGDALLTLAFEILGAPETHPDAAVRCALVAELAASAGMAGMVGGQMLDLQAEKRRDLGLGEIILLQSLKTGALFRFALESGAILADADAASRGALRSYADKVGLAFQIADDILDHEGSPEALGKRTQKDAGAGKATFITLLGLDGAKRRAQELVEQACSALDRYGAKADVLRQAARFIVERKS